VRVKRRAWDSMAMLSSFSTCTFCVPDKRKKEKKSKWLSMLLAASAGPQRTKSQHLFQGGPT
jgi:hypothetical protein